MKFCRVPSQSIPLRKGPDALQTFHKTFPVTAHVFTGCSIMAILIQPSLLCDMRDQVAGHSYPLESYQLKCGVFGDEGGPGKLSLCLHVF